MFLGYKETHRVQRQENAEFCANVRSHLDGREMVKIIAARPLSSGFVTEGLFLLQARLELWAYTPEIWAGLGGRRKLSCSRRMVHPSAKRQAQKPQDSLSFALMISLSEKWFWGLFFRTKIHHERPK